MRPAREAAATPLQAEEQRRAPALLLGESVLIDDADATYVLVLPLGVDADAQREDPKEDWDRLFLRCDQRSAAQGYPGGHGPVPEWEYQELARRRLLEILRESAFKASCAESLDEDEMFLKISLDRNGTMIRNLATNFRYSLPFTDEAYIDADPFGTYPGGRPLANACGDPAPAYQEFREELAGKLRPFRRIDEIRLVLLQLRSAVSLPELVRQGVLARCFPGAEYEVATELHGDWADWRLAAALPCREVDEQLRNYFGEEIAFFFKWYALYTRMLGWVALAGLLCSLAEVPAFELTLAQKDSAKILFAIAMALWRSGLFRLQAAEVQRAVQAWGAEGAERLEEQLGSYDRSLEGTQRLQVRKRMATLAMVLFLLAFVGLLGALNKAMYDAKIARRRLARQEALIQSVVIKVLAFLWRKIAFHLVSLQNHRTQTRWNEAMVWNLSIVKLFLSLWPFTFFAFVKEHVMGTCGADASEAAHRIYQHQGWPRGTSVSVPASEVGTPVPEAELAFLERYASRENGQTCVSGCYPVACFEEGEGLRCVTNCMHSLQLCLATLYAMHVLTTFAWICIPVFLTRCTVRAELRRAAAARGCSARGRLEYTWIQLQAKCHRHARYAFEGWGGSTVEDFLELAVEYALLACFGVACPAVACLGFLCLLLKYRLLAYRMTFVACRPDPRASCGVGLWQDVFDFVGIVALTFNVGLVVHTALPLSDLPSWQQLAVFVVAEKALLSLRGLVGFWLPRRPHDVVAIADFNEQFKRKFVRGKECSNSEMSDYSHVDIGLKGREELGVFCA